MKQIETKTLVSTSHYSVLCDVIDAGEQGGWRVPGHVYG